MCQSMHLLFVLLIPLLIMSACSNPPVIPGDLTSTLTRIPEKATATFTLHPTASRVIPIPTSTSEPVSRAPIKPFTIPSLENSAPASTLLPDPVEMLDGHAAALRIHNVDKMTGRYGQSTRWLAWGAPAFTIVSDGSFWIADVSNRQTRIVHLSSHSELLEVLPLKNLNYVFDVTADQQQAWVLGDNAEQMHTLVQFDLEDGSAWESVLPDEYQIFMSTQAEDGSDWGLTGLIRGEQGELYLERLGGVEFVQVLLEEGELIFLPSSAYPFAGHTYRFTGSVAWLSKGPMLVDEQQIDVLDPADDYTISFLGVAPDGSFYLVYRLGNQRYVRHYSPDGELLGFARPSQGIRALQHDSDPYESDISVGPDGNAYALISTDDQDVVVLRLNFSDELAPPPTPKPYLEPTPMIPMRPAWETPPLGAQAEEIARETLITFFSRLDERQYAQAAELYGGGLEAFEPRFIQSARNHPESDAQVREYLASLFDDPEQFWQSACSTLLACLSIGNITEVERISEMEFRFWVELTWEDGIKYVTNACCGGNPAITPFVWQFPYTVRQVDGRFQVLEPPPLLE